MTQSKDATHTIKPGTDVQSHYKHSLVGIFENCHHLPHHYQMNSQVNTQVMQGGRSQSHHHFHPVKSNPIKYKHSTTSVHKLARILAVIFCVSADHDLMSSLSMALSARARSGDFWKQRRCYFKFRSELTVCPIQYYNANILF